METGLNFESHTENTNIFLGPSEHIFLEINGLK